MRRALWVLALLVLLITPPAGASHVLNGCLGETQVLTTTSCPLSIRCPAPGPVCLWRLELNVHGVGIVSGKVLTGTIAWASCGPAAVECVGMGPFNLPPGAMVALECSFEGPAVLAGYSCSATPMGHV